MLFLFNRNNTINVITCHIVKLMNDQQTKCKELQQEIERLKTRIAKLKESTNQNLRIKEMFTAKDDTLEKIFRIAPTGIGMVKNRMFVEANPLICEITGYSRKELIGKSSRILYPNDSEYEYVGQEKYSQIDKYGTGTVETVWAKKDGSLVDILLSSTAIDINNPSKGTIFTALDISAQKKWENEKQNSADRLKIIFEHAPDPIYIIDLKGKIIDGNIAAEQLLGFKREELIGQSFLNLNLLPPKDLAKATKLLAKNVMGQQTGPDQLTLLTKNGQKISIEITTYPVKLNNQKAVLGIARDITQRIQEEKLRHEREQRMTFHVEQTPLAVIEWDLEYQVKEWNPAAEKIFGYSRAEALGQPASFIIHSDDLQYVNQIFMDTAMHNNKRKNINKNRHKNGELILCEWHNTPLVNEEGKIIALASFGLDITQRIRSEEIQKVVYNISNAANTSISLNKLLNHIREELSTIIDTTNFFIALYDKKNDTFSLPFFIDEKDQFNTFPAGKTLTGYVIKNQTPLLADKQMMRKLELRGETESVGSLSKIWLGIPLKIGEEAIGALVLQSYTDEHAYDQEDMQMLQFVSNQVSQAIHRKNTEEQMANALKRATEADQMKSTFLANMSHEIRTPMTGLLGFASLLKNEKLNKAERFNYLDIIERSGKRMLGVINDLIDISKVESGVSEISICSFNLNDSFKYVYSFFKPEAEAKGLELTYSCAFLHEKAFIETDKEKLYAIIINLVKNAIKYTNSGSISFKYTILNNNINLTVRDTGIGIPKNKLDTIFNRFVQAGTNLSNNYEGVGLGLAITKAYVDLLDGKISVESEYGKGSSFSVEIPYTKGQKADTTKEKEEIENDTNHQYKPKILVAEDDVVNRKLFSYLLKDVADELIIASNGAEAVAKFSEMQDIELIFMDLKMPKMDGYEATRLIREKNKEVIIIALSAFALETERRKAAQSGFNHYVSKPVGKADLIKAIKKYFNI